MKPMIIAALFAAGCVQASELRLELMGAGIAGNQVRIGVYSADAPEQFPSDDKFYRGIVSEATSDRLVVIVPDLPPGRYAVAAYVDKYRTGRQAKNFLGMPKEPYGFSNDARGAFGPPDFSAAAFEIGETAVTKIIHLH